ncbi:MAG TPA: hypothetical protein PLY00_00615 [Verrucomicrobiota bacterium]|nr:hypothetical protein [Verrucomicrobiota bacterium]NMD20630.1 hypothetical protein [Verrucomicrobiota bacterium]HOR69784.1 hypothetical protein [Verrucomicrobiota bacterium]HQA39769.1 hypothetical protein [Verrucomicrobiota bacterium]HQJ99169.1 hypothetical protein [Verrucomicrobiota bacterium]
MMLPRHWAALSLLAGASYMTLGQQIDVGPLSFTVIRILGLIGVVRVLIRREDIAGGVNALDKMIMVWGAWALFSSAFHEPKGEAFVFRLGLVYTAFAVYFLMRCLCRGVEDAVKIFQLTAVLLVPLALEMCLERVTGQNLFAVLGGVPEMAAVRGEEVRAQGPFAHPILAGVAGAAMLPVMIGLRHRHPVFGIVGAVASAVIVICCNSSGPLVSVGIALMGLLWYRWRHRTRQLWILMALGYVMLDIVMKAPAYFLIARIDLTGGSTGWHRAELIRSSIEHVNEWWFAGTDYTRHWMPHGVLWSEDHCDITNYYIRMGVIGGLPLMCLLVGIFAVAFKYVGDIVRWHVEGVGGERLFMWSLGVSLYTHAVTCISVSYFDQSVIYLYVTLAVVGSVHGLFSLAEAQGSAAESEAHVWLGESEKVDVDGSVAERGLLWTVRRNALGFGTTAWRVGRSIVFGSWRWSI